MAVTTLDELSVIISANTKQFLSAFDGINKALKQTQNAVNETNSIIGTKLSSSVDSLQSKVSSFLKTGLTVLGGGLTTIGGLSLKTAADFEKMGVALETALGGDKQAAKEAQEQITAFAAKTPFQLNEVMGAFIKLKNMGLDPSEEALTSYGDTASAMGKSLNDMVEAVADAATGEFERLKEFGIRSSVEGDRVKFTFKGVTTEVGKNAEEIEDYLIKLGQTNFAGGMEKQSRTLGGLFSTLQDTVSLALNKLAVDSGLLDFVKGKLNTLITFLSTVDVKSYIDGFKNAFLDFKDKVTPAIEFVTPIVKDIFNYLKDNKEATVAAIGAIGVAIATTFVPAMISAVTAAAPLTLAIGAIGAAAFLLKKGWDENWNGMRDKLTDFWQNHAKPIVEQVTEWLSVNIPLAMDKVSTWWNENWPAISNTLSDIWNNVLKPIFSGIVEYYQWFIPNALKVMKWAWDNVITPAFTVLKWYWTTILIPVFSGIVGFFTEHIPQAVNFLKDKWDNVLFPVLQMLADVYNENVRPVVEAIVDWFQDKIPQAVNFLKDVWSNILMPIFQYLWNTYENTVKPVFEGIVGWLSDNIPVAIETVADFWNNTLLPAFEWIWDVWTNSVEPVFTALVDTLGVLIPAAIDIFSASWDNIKVAWNWVKENFITEPIDRVRGAIDLLSGSISNVTEFFGGLIDKINIFNNTDPEQKSINTPNGDIQEAPNFYASGTSSSLPGWAWVGENGPELMKLPGGTQIQSTPNSFKSVFEAIKQQATSYKPEDAFGGFVNPLTDKIKELEAKAKKVKATTSKAPTVRTPTGSSSGTIKVDFDDRNILRSLDEIKDAINSLSRMPSKLPINIPGGSSPVGGVTTPTVEINNNFQEVDNPESISSRIAFQVRNINLRY